MSKYTSQIMAFALIIGSFSFSGRAAVYDDFSSGDLSRWTYAPANTSFEPTVVSNQLVWGGSTTGGWKGGTLVSTETGFDLSSQSTSIVQVTVSEIIPRDSAVTTYDSFGFGWQAENGDIADIRYSWRADSTNNNVVFQMRYTALGGSTVLLGSTAYFNDFPIENGDILKLVYLRDDNRLEVYRERSGTETLLFGRTAASLANLSGYARIYLSRNDASLNSSVTLDDIATSPWAVVGESRIVFQDTFSTDGSLAGRPVELGFGTLWQSDAAMMSSNGVALPAATGPAKVAALPFVPEQGKMYSLSADINAISGNWLAIGFLSETNQSTITGNGWFYSSVDEPSPWMYTTPAGAIRTYAGPGATVSELAGVTGSNGTMKIVLDTSATDWVATYYFDDIPLRTNVYSGSLSITHVAFGGYPVSISEVDNFILSEESALTGYALWSASWGDDIGSMSDDYDGDGLANLYEYGVGGDPVNPLDQGTAAACGLMDVGGTPYFGYIHPQLSDPDSGLAYSLEECSDLGGGVWTAAGYSILGTNVSGGTLDMVTNYTDMADNQKFLRLVVEEAE
jgi:hypothetical protein